MVDRAGLRFRVPLLIAVATLVAAALPLGTAWAATSSGPSAWSSAAPADGSVIGALRPTISVAVADANGFVGYPYYSLKVDGSLQRTTLTWTSPDHTGAILTFTPTYNLALGAHTVTATILNGSYKYSTYRWAFTIAQTPVLSVASPSAGSTVASTQPVISATVTGSTGPMTAHVILDGSEIPSTYDSGSQIVRATPPSAIGDNASHDVTVTVTNSQNVSAVAAWSFNVQLYAPMPVVTDCTACHAGFPAAHPMTDCVGCHGIGSPVGEGWDTPAYAEHSSDHIAGMACTTCHGSGYLTVPPLHAFQPDSYHASGLTSCAKGAPCHLSSLSLEHDRRGHGLTCLTCHESTDTRVQIAIAAGDTRCESCHVFDGTTGHPYIPSAHVSSVATSTISGTYPSGVGYGPIQCQACHVTELYPEHARTSSSAAAAGCGACHPSPRDTLSPWGKTCAQAGCHAPGSGVGQHERMATRHTLPADDAKCTAAGCHDKGDLGAVHTNATTTTAGVTVTSCNVCHSTTGMPSTKICWDCHPEKVDANGNVTSHGFDPVRHTATPSPATITIDGTAWGPYACTDCHSVQLYTEHTKPTSSSAASGCGACHPSPRDTLTPSWDHTTCAQGGCHTATSTKPMHASVDTFHTRLSPTNDQCALSGCHTSDLAGIHSAATTTTAGVTYTGCRVCHGAGVPVSQNCLSCHPEKVDGSGNVVAHGYPTAKHQASMGATPFTGTLPYSDPDLGPLTYNVPCGQCHLMDLYSEHQKYGKTCGTCHPTPRGTFTDWNTTCQQGGCHTTYHTQMSQMHAQTKTSSCSSGGYFGCHGTSGSLVAWGSMDAASAHDDYWLWQQRGYANYPFSPMPQNGCALCHTGPTAPPPTKTNCDDCHGSGWQHP